MSNHPESVARQAWMEFGAFFASLMAALFVFCLAHGTQWGPPAALSLFVLAMTIMHSAML